VLISSDGYVLTNEHVVEGASAIRATLLDGRTLEAEMVGSDVENDLALLKLKRKPGAAPLPFLELRRRPDLMVGETVVAIGNPYGLQSTVTRGVISALNRTVSSEKSGRTYADFIQTDASINPGNSGGALVDLDGGLAGINTAIIASAQGIGFAIPATRARRVVDDLLRFGHVRRLWLGAVLRPVMAHGRSVFDRGRVRGLMIRRIFPGSPAAQAGLRRGDLIVEIGGRRAANLAQLRTALANLSPGGTLRLRVLGDAGEVAVTVRPRHAPQDLGTRLFARWLGVEVADSPDGVVIRKVYPGSPAASTGLEPGDVILAVHGRRVPKVADLDDVVASDPDAASIFLVVGRGRYAYNLTFPLDG
jgi:serine protease Do